MPRRSQSLKTNLKRSCKFRFTRVLLHAHPDDARYDLIHKGNFPFTLFPRAIVEDLEPGMLRVLQDYALKRASLTKIPESPSFQRAGHTLRNQDAPVGFKVSVLCKCRYHIFVHMTENGLPAR